VAFSIFGKKDEPEKKNDPAAKKEPVAGKPAGPTTISPGAGKPPPGKPAVAQPKPASAGAKAPTPKESIPVEEDDLDFTSLLIPPAKAATPEAPAAARKAAVPAPPPASVAKAPAPQASTPAAAPAAKVPPAAAPVAKAPPAEPAARTVPAAPVAKPPPFAATPPPPPHAKAAAPSADDLGSVDPGTLGGGAKSGPVMFEKTWMPEGRALAPEKQGAPKPPTPQAAPPARPRGTASAGPTAPPLAAVAPKPAAAPAAPPPVSGAAAKSPVSPAIAVASPVAGTDTQPAEKPPLEVSASELALPPAIEQAAVLFANGQVEAAVNALKAAIAANDLGDAALQAWLMLFDLYQLQGRKDEHETLALEFVVKFERSAPAWRDEPKEAKDPALQRGAGSYFALTGELSAASAPEIAQLAKLAEKHPILRIEFGELKGVDAAGARLLLDLLKGFGKSNRELILSNHTTLVGLLAGKAAVGRKEEPQVYWMLLLEVFQVFGLQTEFDDTALNFAITYEVSPPSFEERAKPAKAETPSAVSEVGEEGFVMSGEICGSNEGAFAALVKYAANRDDVVIDMGRAKRVDFVAAGAMLNAITGLAGSGKTVQIRSANELIGALFQAVGIARLAQLVKRR
jgi:anti-anti-sigma regulatory factor